MNMLIPLHNFFPFQSNLMTCQTFFGLRLHQMVSQTQELRCSTFISRGLIFADFAVLIRKNTFQQKKYLQN